MEDANGQQKRREMRGLVHALLIGFAFAILGIALLGMLTLTGVFTGEYFLGIAPVLLGLCPILTLIDYGDSLPTTRSAGN